MFKPQLQIIVAFMVIVLTACSNPASNSDTANTEVGNSADSGQAQPEPDRTAEGPNDDTSGNEQEPNDEPANVFEYQSLDNTYSYRLDANENNDNWLVFVHGGNWLGGSKDDALFYNFRGVEANAVLAQFNVASLEYQLWDPEMGTGTHLEQTTNVIDFLHTVKTDSNKVCLMGHSAGAHIAAAVAVRHPELIDCFIGIAGVYDMSEEGRQFDPPPIQEQLASYTEQSSIETSPSAVITASYDVDTLLMHSTNDPAVSYTHSVNFAEQIEQDTQAAVTLVLDDELLPVAAHNILYFTGADWIYPDRMALLDFIDSQLQD